jgi:hypothetical protein
LYIVESGSDILGRDLVQALHINIEGSTLTCSNINPEKESSANLPDSVHKFDSLFKTEDELKPVTGFVHKIKVNEKVRPVSQKLRRLPFSVRDKVSEELKKLEKQGIIEKINSAEWVSPIVVSWKKNGKLRLCVDLRQVNEAIIPDKYPLPKIDEIFSELRNASVFTQLDLQSAYHQLLLHKDSRSMTAFITHEGLFQYKRVCFGLSSAPSAFQKMMSTMLSGLKGVQSYLDDLIIYGKDQAEHDRNLQAVLEILEKYGVKLNKDKCLFSRTSLNFLGHTVSASGIQVDDKYQAITNAPAPHDKKSLRSFLGLAGYFSKYIPRFATMVEPLRTLLRNDCCVWTEEAQHSMDALKCTIGHSPTLSMFDPDADVILTTDASAYGLGAVLTQMKNGKEVTVECASRTLSTTERKYSVGEREALACVWACEKFNIYLWGRKFTLCTDHQALITLLKKGSDRQSMRIARWSARLMKYNYDLKFKRGQENKVADALSRLPIPAEVHELDSDDTVICHIALETMCKSVTLEKLQECTKEDQVLNTVKKHIQTGWPDKLRQLDSEIISVLKPYYMIKDDLTICDDVIMRNDRIVIPKELTGSLLKLAHESHQGMTRTKQRLRELYWWPCMDKQVENIVKSCITCQLNDKSVKQTTAPMTPVPYPNCAWCKVGIDIVGPFEKGPVECRYAITLVDYYSKWPEMCFASNVKTKTVITFLKTVFSREGFPEEIISDNGVQFTSTEFNDFLDERGIRHGYASLYYPQSNGAVERFNGVLKNAIQNAININKPWKATVYEYLAVYRATPHATTGVAPCVLLHGRHMRTKLNILGLKMPVPNLTKLKTKANERVKVKQSQYKKYGDRKKNVKVVDFQVGDWVRVKKPGLLMKGDRRYSDPIQIARKLSSNTYVTSDSKTWNVSKLIKARRTETNSSLYFDFEESDHSSQISKTNSKPEEEKQPLRRSERVKRKPNWMKDYIMY